jgi:Protein of unknown function (DUF3987)
MTDEARDTYSKRIKTLAGLSKVKNSDGELVPRVVHLSKDALGYLTAFMDEIEPKLAEGGDLHLVADWASKLAGAIARIAAILHYAKHSLSLSNVPDIQPDTVKRAIEIGRYLIQHALAACAEMGADPLVENAKHILLWIQREQIEVFTKRDAHRANIARFKKVTELEPILELIEAHGYIRTQARAAEPGKVGRKSSQLFEVNPFFTLNDTIDTIDKTPADEVHSVNSVNSVINDENVNVAAKPDDVEVF